MNAALIQPREEFGPPDRVTELHHCWAANDVVFSHVIAPSGRPTFNELFSLCMPDAVNIIANSDIEFTTQAVDLIVENLQPNQCYALSRYDFINGTPTLWSHADSQDVWCFRGVPRGIDAPFTMGVAGCDNSLAWLIKMAGYDIRNPSKTIRTYHRHDVPWRSYLVDPEGKARGGDKIERIPPPYHLVRPTEL